MIFMATGLYVFCASWVIYAMRSKSMIKSNAIISIMVYCCGIVEILFCGIDFPIAMIYSYVGSIIVNYVIHSLKEADSLKEAEHSV